MIGEKNMLKGGVDAAAVCVTISTIMGWLPAIAALFTIVWTILRIAESLDNLGWIKLRRKQ